MRIVINIVFIGTMLFQAYTIMGQQKAVIVLSDENRALRYMYNDCRSGR